MPALKRNISNTPNFTAQKLEKEELNTKKKI